MEPGDGWKKRAWGRAVRGAWGCVDVRGNEDRCWVGGKIARGWVRKWKERRKAKEVGGEGEWGWG